MAEKVPLGIHIVGFENAMKVLKSANNLGCYSINSRKVYYRSRFYVGSAMLCAICNPSFTVSILGGSKEIPVGKAVVYNYTCFTLFEYKYNGIVAPGSFWPCSERSYAAWVTQRPETPVWALRHCCL